MCSRAPLGVRYATPTLISARSDSTSSLVRLTCVRPLILRVRVRVRVRVGTDERE